MTKQPKIESDRKHWKTKENNLNPPQTTENKIESPENPKQFKRPSKLKNNLKHINQIWITWNNLIQPEGQKAPQTTVHKTKRTLTSQEQLETTWSNLSDLWSQSQNKTAQNFKQQKAT